MKKQYVLKARLAEKEGNYEQAEMFWRRAGMLKNAEVCHLLKRQTILSQDYKSTVEKSFCEYEAGNISFWENQVNSVKAYEEVFQPRLSENALFLLLCLNRGIGRETQHELLTEDYLKTISELINAEFINEFEGCWLVNAAGKEYLRKK